MKLVLALNAVSSQVWAVILILLGIGTFWLACHCSEHDARTELMSTGTGMVGGGIAMFQHQSKEPQPPESQKQ